MQILTDIYVLRVWWKKSRLMWPHLSFPLRYYHKCRAIGNGFKGLFVCTFLLCPCSYSSGNTKDGFPCGRSYIQSNLNGHCQEFSGSWDMLADSPDNFFGGMKMANIIMVWFSLLYSQLCYSATEKEILTEMPGLQSFCRSAHIEQTG